MTTSSARLSLSTPTDVLDVVPTLLGFIPTESLILVYLDAIGRLERVTLTARMDLPVDAVQRTAVLTVAEHRASRHDTLILVAYSADPDAADNTLLHLLNTDLKVRVTVSATPQGWAEIAVGEPTHRLPYPDTTSAVTAGIAAAGYQPLHRTRDDLIDSIAAPPVEEAEQFAVLVNSSEPLTRSQLAAWLHQWASSDRWTVDIAEAAVLVASVQTLDVRDTAWAAMTSADADLRIDLWRQVARLVDGRAALPVLGLLGMAAWIGGQGALANMVLDRARLTDGHVDYTLIGLLHEILQRGVHPQA